jgi:chitinase
MILPWESEATSTLVTTALPILGWFVYKFRQSADKYRKIYEVLIRMTYKGGKWGKWGEKPDMSVPLADREDAQHEASWLMHRELMDGTEFVQLRATETVIGHHQTSIGGARMKCIA